MISFRSKIFKSGPVSSLFVGSLFFLASLLSPVPVAAQEDAAVIDYQVKAIWLVRLLRFVDWPPVVEQSQSGISIGIIGEDPFGNYFDPVEGREIMGKKLVIKRLGAFDEETDLSGLRILFVTESERRNLTRILDRAAGLHVLTVSEIDGFLDRGGMVNFVNVDQTVQFEINEKALHVNGLRISSEILGRAHRVIRRM